MLAVALVFGFSTLTMAEEAVVENPTEKAVETLAEEPAIGDVMAEEALENKAVWVQDTVEDQEFRDGDDNDPTP